jgi:hypothetical protein
MEVGIEDCLHIEFEYDRAKYHLKDVVVGKIYFLLVGGWSFEGFSLFFLPFGGAPHFLLFGGWSLRASCHLPLGRANPRSQLKNPQTLSFQQSNPPNPNTHSKSKGAHQAEAHGAGDPPPRDHGRGVWRAQRERDDSQVRNHGRGAGQGGKHPDKVGCSLVVRARACGADASQSPAM